MNQLKYLFILGATSIAITSCNNADEKGSSTPIDTTNVKGTAPATYGPDNPASDSAYPVYEGAGDTSLKANTMSAEDSARNRHLK